MEAVFLKILNMSLSAALVIVVVLLARLLLRRAPGKWRYLLWIVVAFRLLCPVSISAPFSILRLTAQPAVTQTSAGSSEIAYIPQNIGMMAQPRVYVGTPFVSEVISQSLPAPTPEDSANPLQIWIAVGTVLWCAGMTALLLYGIISYLRLRHRLTGAVRVENGVCETDAVRAPFILGLLRPVIYLPVGLEGETLRYVLAHERFHIRHGDHAVKLLAFLLLTVHWFNPLVWLAFALMCRDMEMRCDEAVLSEESGVTKPYSMALLSFATERRFPSPSPLCFGETSVKERIKNVLRWKRPKTWVTVAAALLCVVAVAACAVNPGREKTEGGTPWDWTSTVTAAGIKSAEGNGMTLDAEQTQRLVELLNAVRPEEVVRGRGIPSNQVLDVTTGVGYRLRWAGGIIELDFDDAVAAAELYGSPETLGPGVWEIHNDALYAFLEGLKQQFAPASTPFPVENETQDMSTLLCKREDVVSVRVEGARAVYVNTNQTEREMILNKLYAADCSEFRDAEPAGVMGATVSFSIDTKEIERNIRIVSDESAQFIVITTPDGDRKCWKGPGDSFDFSGLNQLVSGVLGNEDDPAYSGTVILADREFRRAVNKGNSAIVRAILDGALNETEASGIDLEATYNIKFRVGKVVYGIDSETGQFFREDEGKTKYARIESQKLTVVKTCLGVLSITEDMIGGEIIASDFEDGVAIPVPQRSLPSFRNADGAELKLNMNLQALNAALDTYMGSGYIYSLPQHALSAAAALRYDGEGQFKQPLWPVVELSFYEGWTPSEGPGVGATADEVKAYWGEPDTETDPEAFNPAKLYSLSYLLPDGLLEYVHRGDGVIRTINLYASELLDDPSILTPGGNLTQWHGRSEAHIENFSCFGELEVMCVANKPEANGRYSGDGHCRMSVTDADGTETVLLEGKGDQKTIPAPRIENGTLDVTMEYGTGAWFVTVDWFPRPKE